MHVSLFGYLNSELTFGSNVYFVDVVVLKLCINTEHRIEGVNFFVVYMYDSVINLNFI